MNRVYLVTLSMLLTLTACGGSGGGSTGPTSPPPPGGNQATLVVTTTNAKPAARAAYDASLQATDTGALVGDSGISASPDSGLSKPGVENGIGSAISRVMGKPPLGPDTFDCGISGTQTISGNLASLFTLTAGDFINVEANNCDDGLGEVINGRLEMTIVSFSGTPSALYRLEVDVTLVNFGVTTATDTVVSNGDSTVVLDTFGLPMVLTSIDGDLMETVTNTTTETVTNFSTSQTVDTSVQPEPYTLSASGTVNSTALSGSVTYTTTVTFQGAGGGYPFAGEMLLTGANGATIRLIALDETNVRIETDTDGDGVVDDTEDTTWDDIAI